MPKKIINKGSSDTDFPACFLAFVIAMVYFCLITLCVKNIYQPDIAAVLLKARQLFPAEILDSMAPEPVERMQYLIATFTVPVVIVSALYFARNMVANNPKMSESPIGTMLLALIVTAVIAFYSYIAVKNSDYLYVRCTLLYRSPIIYSLVAYPIMMLLAWYDGNRVIRNVNAMLLCLFAAFLVYVIFCINLFNHDTVPHTLHFNPVIYPLAQVVNGKQLLHNWTGVYGLYPVFLEPLFRLVRLDVVSFSTLMAAMEAAMVCIIAYYMGTLFSNRFILLVGVIAAFFLGPLGLKTIIAPPDKLADPYFQYMPLRMFFPALLLLMVAVYRKNRHTGLCYWLTSLVCSIAILWNFESGLVVFVSWILFLGYIELFRNDPTTAAQRILGHLIRILCLFMLIFILFNLYQYARYGALPDWTLFSKYQRFYYLYGYYMLKMPDFPHAWNLLLVVFMAGMVISINGLFTKEDEVYNSNIFLLTLLGVGIFVYYQGRSHDYNIFPILYVPIITVCYMLDKILQSVKSGNVSGYKYVPVALFLFYVLASAVPGFAAATEKFISWSRVGLNSLHTDPESVNSRNIAFIKRFTVSGEKVLILIPGDLDGIYFAETRTASAIDAPSFSDYLLLSEFRDLDLFVEHNPRYKIFAIPEQTPRYIDTLRTNYFMMAVEKQTGLALYIPKVTQVR